MDRPTKVYTLLDAEERAAQAPESFAIPAKQDREQLRVGDDVKLIFSPGERMWVTVTRSKEDGHYLGTLANEPVDVAGLEYDDVIAFGPEHVIDIVRG